MALPEDHWIHKALEKPGELHRRLGIPQGEKIPTKKLLQAAKLSNDKVKGNTPVGDMMTKQIADLGPEE